MPVRIESYKKVTSKTGGTVATANVILDEQVCIFGVRLIQGQNGLFIGMPSYKSEKMNKWFPHIKILKDDIKFAIADKFKEIHGQDKSQAQEENLAPGNELMETPF